MFDRIGRRDDETPFVVEWLTRNGIAVWSVCEGEQRFDNHMDKLTNYIRYWQAAGESEKISERTRTRIRQLTEAGFFTGGQCPYGYELVRGTRLNKKNQPMNDLRICESEAEVVRLMFGKAAREGFAPMRIANYLNGQGIQPRKKKRWNPASIGHILSSRLYLGFLQKGDAQSPYLPQLQIVEEEQFFRVQEIRASRKKEEPGNMVKLTTPTRAKALLSGFLYCAHCGARMNSTIHRKEYQRKNGSLYRWDVRVYRCNASIDGVPLKFDGPRTYRAKRIEEAFKAVISTLLEQLEALPVEAILEYTYQIALKGRRQEYEQAHTALSEKQRDYETLRNEIARVLRGESKFDLTLLQSILEETEQAVEEQSTQLYELEAKLQNAEQLRREIEIKQRKYCGLNHISTNSTMEEKKMLLSILIRRVEVKRDYELNIQLAPGFEQFLDGLIEIR